MSFGSIGQAGLLKKSAISPNFKPIISPSCSISSDPMASSLSPHQTTLGRLAGHSIAWVLGGLLVTVSAQAQILDAITGHANDIKARFAKNTFINGVTLKQGDIDTTAKGQDPIHNSSGTWSLIRVGKDLYLQSAANFKSSPGPDYHVYISKSAAIKDNPEFDAQQIEVSRLLKPNGAAYYKLTTTDADEVKSVLIWCKQFKEYIGSADLIESK
ncbi:MAG: hypothetical protein EBT70_03105 [Betaproteobacteria bacterium]|nr:hypothetical protein [Betaproteobacteria bacterium]